MQKVLPYTVLFIEIMYRDTFIVIYTIVTFIIQSTSTHLIIQILKKDNSDTVAFTVCALWI